MDFHLFVSMNNAAFDNAPVDELVRILATAIAHIAEHGVPEPASGNRVSLRDHNGNVVGNFHVEGE